MLMKAKERWHCVNPACGCQVIVEVSGEIDGQNPRCACGGIMKKKYAAPRFRISISCESMSHQRHRR